MLPIIIGVICILGGIGWGLMTMFAAGMASRQTTWQENTGTPMLGLIPIAIGIAIIVWG